MFESLEQNPTLRERVLGLTAIGAILVGGAAGVDSMLTGGWQIGGVSDANAAPVIYAQETSQQYFDDVGRDYSTTPPQRVQLAAQDVSVDPSEIRGGLTGANDGVVTQTSFAPQSALPPQQTGQVSTDPNEQQRQQAADQHFNAIEAEVRQATVAVQPSSATKDADENALPS